MRRVLGLLSVCLLVCSNAAFALTWDFENPNQEKEFSSPNGTWGIKDGVMMESNALNAAAQRNLVGDESWTDYTIEAKIRIDKGNWAGIVFRAQSDFEYYVAYLNVPDNKSELWRHSKPAHDSRAAINSNFPAQKTKVENAKWMTVKIEIAGDKFTYTLNDQLQWEAQDGQYKRGKIGVWTWQTAASFDDLSVNGKGIPTGLAIKPAGKATTTWAALKAR
jgi:hypothetical protein